MPAKAETSLLVKHLKHSAYFIGKLHCMYIAVVTFVSVGRRMGREGGLHRDWRVRGASWNARMAHAP